MTRVYRNPNPYTDTLFSKYFKYGLILVLIMFAAAMAYYYTKTDNIFLALFGYGLIPIFLMFSDKITNLMDKNDRGAVGEGDVRRELEKLSDDYAIFQNVPIKKHLDIDLVLVGPTGVYAIEVKSYRSFRLSGDGKNFIQETLSETMGMKEYLKNSGIDIYVNSALVFSKAFVKYQAPQKGVHIMNKKFLLNFVSGLNRVNYDQIKAEELIKNLYLSN